MGPKVERNEDRGRARLDTPEEVLLYLRSLGIYRTEIARIPLVLKLVARKVLNENCHRILVGFSGM